jgi:hypothetical protein
MLTSVALRFLAPSADKRDAAVFRVGRDERAAAIADGTAAMPNVDAAAFAHLPGHSNVACRRVGAGGKRLAHG